MAGYLAMWMKLWRRCLQEALPLTQMSAAATMGKATTMGKAITVGKGSMAAQEMGADVWNISAV